MTKDIAPELYEACEKDFDRLVKGSKKIQKYLTKVKDGKATYEDMYYYSTQIGECLKQAFKDNISEDMLPDGRMYYNIAERVVRPLMEKAELMIDETCTAVQDELNAKAGLGVKSV